MFRYLMPVLALCVFPALLNAAPQKYECTIDGDKSGGWVPNRAIYMIDSQAGNATAFDPLIESVEKKPIPARFRQTASGKYKLSWNLRNVPVRKTRTVENMTVQDFETKASVSYSAWLNPANMQIEIRASAGGATNRNFGRGVCKTVK